MPVCKTRQLARLYLLQNSLLKFPIFENRKIYVYIYVYTCLSSHLLYDCFDKISARLSFTSAQICWSLPPVPAFVLSSGNVNRSFYRGELFIHPMKASLPPPHFHQSMWYFRIPSSLSYTFWISSLHFFALLWHCPLLLLSFWRKHESFGGRLPSDLLSCHPSSRVSGRWDMRKPVSEYFSCGAQPSFLE